MRRITCYLSALLIATISAIVSVPSAHATIGTAGCSGIACNGQDPVSAGCLSSGVEIQEQTVADVGNIYLFESPTCGTAWARLNVSPTSMAITHGDIQQLSEIFYEPPTGGVEAFEATVWDGQSSDVAYSLMVPVTGSVKACGGDMGNNAFDEDPQGTQDLEQPGTNNDYFLYGACTLWH